MNLFLKQVLRRKGQQTQKRGKLKASFFRVYESSYIEQDKKQTNTYIHTSIQIYIYIRSKKCVSALIYNPYLISFSNIYTQTIQLICMNNAH